MRKLIAHRGIYDEYIKENSYDAIKKALDSDKYYGVEFDIRETKDNELIIYHDATYNNKLVSDTYFKEMPKYIARLTDVLKINSNKIFLLEIKNISNNYGKFMKILDKFKDKNLYVMSFSSKAINKINSINRNYKVGILNYVLNTSEDIKKLDFVAVLNNLLNDNIINKLENMEIFSYGGFKNLKYKNVYYIVDDKINI